MVLPLVADYNNNQIYDVGWAFILKNYWVEFDENLRDYF